MCIGNNRAALVNDEPRARAPQGILSGVGEAIGTLPVGAKILKKLAKLLGDSSS